MIPKEKAQELFDKMMYHIMYNCQPTLSEMVARECALIAVDEILYVLNEIDSMQQWNASYFYNQVKQEI